MYFSFYSSPLLLHAMPSCYYVRLHPESATRICDRFWTCNDYSHAHHGYALNFYVDLGVKVLYKETVMASEPERAYAFCVVDPGLRNVDVVAEARV